MPPGGAWQRSHRRAYYSLGLYPPPSAIHCCAHATSSSQESISHIIAPRGITEKQISHRDIALRPKETPVPNRLSNTHSFSMSPKLRSRGSKHTIHHQPKEPFAFSYHENRIRRLSSTSVHIRGSPPRFLDSHQWGDHIEGFYLLHILDSMR